MSRYTKRGLFEWNDSVPLTYAPLISLPAALYCYSQFCCGRFSKIFTFSLLRCSWLSRLELLSQARHYCQLLCSSVKYLWGLDQEAVTLLDEVNIFIPFSWSASRLVAVSCAVYSSDMGSAQSRYFIHLWFLLRWINTTRDAILWIIA